MRSLVAIVAAVAIVASTWAGVGLALGQMGSSYASAGTPGGAPGDDFDHAGEITAVLAQAPPGGPPAPPGPPADIAKRLNLTEAQTRKFQQLRAAHEQKTSRLRIALSRARLDARELMLETSPDRGKIEAVSRRIGDLYGQTVRARLEYTAELRQLLTPEQWSQLRAMTARRMMERRARPRP